MGRMFGTGREPLNLLKANVIYAMENSKSNMEAARFLRVSYPTYKKYAKMYKDDETTAAVVAFASPSRLFSAYIP